MTRLVVLGWFAVLACGAEAQSNGEDRRVVQVVAGAQHTCALYHDGGVSCWGLDGAGGDVVPPSTVPQLKARALAAGDDTTCAIVDAGQVTCFGKHAVSKIMLADGSAISAVSRLAVGAGFGCAANPEGVYCWGSNARGELARPLELERSTRAVLAMPGPATLLSAGMTVLARGAADRLCAWGDNSSQVIAASSDIGVYTQPICDQVPDVVALAAGSVHACMLDTSGAVRCWGERYYGQLGIGGSSEATAPIPPYGARAAWSGPAAMVVAGLSHTCALLRDGTVDCFGLNIRGQVGPVPDPDESHVLAPTHVAGLNGRVVGLGAGSSAQHTCAIIADGSVQCWGANSAGQLGNLVTGVNDARFSAAPLRVPL